MDVNVKVVVAPVTTVRVSTGALIAALVALGVVWMAK